VRRKINSRNKYSFGSEFAETRHLSGLTVAQAAKIVSRDVRTITDWEAGKQPCPVWATRLLILESRYMDALYGLQRDRGRTGRCVGYGRDTRAANDKNYSAVPSYLELVEL